MSEVIPVACLAPELTDEKLARYADLIAALPASRAKSVAEECLACVRAWWELPASHMRAERALRIVHKGKTHEIDITPLTRELADKLFDVTPWTEDTVAMGAALDSLTGEVRDAAYHLLWFATELSLDREPMTIGV